MAWPILLCAVVAGLFAMHGMQPTPGPTTVASVFAMHVQHDDMPSNGTKGHDPQMPSHDGHGGGEVCLALLVMGALILLAVRTLGASLDSRFTLFGQLVPRTGLIVLPRGPTLAQLCVLRR
jgi:hypothetical protein